MAEPTHVDTAIGIDKFKQEPIRPEHRTHRRQTYRRTCQHYVTNNNTSTAPTVTIITNGAGTQPVINFGSIYYAAFDQGFVNIPFMSTSMAMDAADWDAIQMEATRFRIVDCGFEITRITCSQQTITSSGATTTVTNQFTQAPTLMLVEDTDHVLQAMATTINPNTTAPSQCATVSTAPGIANKSFAHSFSAGVLPKVWWLQACGLGTVFDAEISFDILKGGKVNLLSTSDVHKYHWTNPDTERWVSPFNMGNYDTLNDETVRGTSFYSNNPGQGSITAAIQQNLATDVNRNLISIPCSHFIRVPPLYTQLGPVTVTLELWIEYSMTVEWVPGRYLTTRALTGGDGSALAGNMLPFAEHRRMMLALSAGNLPPPSAAKDKKRKIDDTQRVPMEWQPPKKYQPSTSKDQTDSAPLRKARRYVDVEESDDE